MQFQTFAVFDLDGVIADTISVLYDIYAGMIAPHGGNATDEEFQYLNGKTLDEIVDHLIEVHGIETDRETYKRDYLDRMGSIYAMAEPSPGMPELLEALRDRGIRIGLASSAPRDGIDLFFQRHGLTDYFEIIVSGDDVEHAKPDPAIYLKAREHFGVGRYFVLEDADNGLKSAMRAGMEPVFYNPDGRDVMPGVTFSIQTADGFLSCIDDESQPCFVALGDDIEIAQTGEKQFDAALSQAIDANWRSACNGNPKLFDGAILTADAIDMDGKSIRLACSTAGYRAFLYQLAHPDADIVDAVGVAGITQDADGNILIGKRSEDVTSYPGYWELVPSGTLPPGEEPEAQLQTELEEEAGIRHEKIASTSLIGLIYDPGARILDIAYRIHVTAFETMQPDEYSQLRVLRQQDAIGEFSKDNQLVKCSCLLLRA